MRLFSLALAMCVAASLPTHSETLRVAIDVLPPSLGNPFRTAMGPTIYATGAIFDGLTHFDAEGKLQPALAVRWENIDPLTWRFHLRPNVKFSNGAAFTAEAVVAAVNYFTSDDGAREGAKREVRVVKSARAVDALTVDITTVEPVPLLPRHVAGLLVPEPEQWKKLGRDGFARQPIGTGPFAIESMGNTQWKLKAFTGSWHPPKVSNLEIVALPEPASRVQALGAGRVDVALRLSPDNIPAVEDSGGKAVIVQAPSVFGITFITTRKGPFQDVRVRRALNMAVDRDRIVKGLLAGKTETAHQPASRGALGFDPTIPPYPFDPAAAKKLLAEAGYPNGFAFTLDAVVGAVANDGAVFQQVQSDLKAIGVAMTVRSLPGAQYINKLSRTEFEGDAFPVAWPTWPSLDVVRALEAHSCMRSVPWFCDKALTEQMDAATSEWNEAKAMDRRKALSRAYHDAAPALFLFETPMVVGLSARVKGFAFENALTLTYDKIELAP